MTRVSECETRSGAPQMRRRWSVRDGESTTVKRTSRSISRILSLHAAGDGHPSEGYRYQQPHATYPQTLDGPPVCADTVLRPCHLLVLLQVGFA